MTRSKGIMAAFRARNAALIDRLCAYVDQHGPSRTNDLLALLEMPLQAGKEVLRHARQQGRLVCVGRSIYAAWCTPSMEADYRRTLYPQKLARRRKARAYLPRRAKPVRDDFVRRIVSLRDVRIRMHPRAVRSVFELAAA